MTVRFVDSVKEQPETVSAAIIGKQSRQAIIEAFLKTLSAHGSLAEKLDTALWCEPVDFVTVYAKNDVRFTFKNRTEIRIYRNPALL